MNKLLPRYKIWQHASGSNRSAAGASRQIEDLVALMALYDYRPLIETELQGTCSFANGVCASCKTKSISSDSVTLAYEASGSRTPQKSGDIKTGSAIQLKLEQIGAVHGVVASKKASDLHVNVDDSCKPMLRSKLARMAAEHAVELHEGSAQSNVKIEPAVKKCDFIDHTGTMRQGVVVNLSRTDALIKARIIPPVRSRIMFCGPRRRPAEILRNFEMGFLARFANSISSEEFTESIKLT